MGVNYHQTGLRVSVCDFFVSMGHHRTTQNWRFLDACSSWRRVVARTWPVLTWSGGSKTTRSRRRAKSIGWRLSPSSAEMTSLHSKGWPGCDKRSTSKLKCSTCSASSDVSLTSTHSAISGPSTGEWAEWRTWPHSSPGTLPPSTFSTCTGSWTKQLASSIRASLCHSFPSSADWSSRAGLSSSGTGGPWKCSMCST